MEDEKKENNVDTQATTDNAQKEQKTENKNEGTKANEQSKSKNGITKTIYIRCITRIKNTTCSYRSKCRCITKQGWGE